MTDWYLIVFDRHGIATACMSLRAIGCEVYFPREKVAVTRLNRRVKIERPLLYKYAFVKGNDPHAIEDSRGVYRVLRDYTTDRFATVSERQVERFRRDERAGKFDSTIRQRMEGPYKPKTRVRVIDGPFRDCMGETRRYASLEVVRVWLEGRFIAKIHVDALEVA